MLQHPMTAVYTESCMLHPVKSPELSLCSILYSTCLTLPLMEWRKPMSIGLSRGERVSMICLAILTQYQSVSDKQTSFNSTVHAMHCTALCVMCCNNKDKKNVKVKSNKLWCKWQIHYLTCEDPWAILTDTSHQDSCVQNLSYQHHLHHHQPASFAVIHNQK